MARRAPRSGSNAAPAGTAGTAGIAPSAAGCSPSRRESPAAHLRVVENVIEFDQSAGAAAGNVRKIERKAPRERSRHRHRALAGVAVTARAPDGRLLDKFLFARDRHAADHRSGIEIDERRAGRHDVTDGAVQRRDDTAVGHRHLDHRFGRFHRQHRLVDQNAIARLDVPFEDFGLGQSFAQIRKPECAHVRSLSE